MRRRCSDSNQPTDVDQSCAYGHIACAYGHIACHGRGYGDRGA